MSAVRNNTMEDRSEDKGPLLESLTHRLSQCPREFLFPPRIAKSGRVYVAAVVGDLIEDITGEIPYREALLDFANVSKNDDDWLRLVLLACWLLHDSWFLNGKMSKDKILKLLSKDIRTLAPVITPEQCVLEPDRREELARFCLDALGICPAGETPTQAADRLKALDSVERIRVMLETKRAEEHARRVREAMAKKKAREAASKVMRE